jgi:hypothetical protein
VWLRLSALLETVCSVCVGAQRFTCHGSVYHRVCTLEACGALSEALRLTTEDIPAISLVILYKHKNHVRAHHRRCKTLLTKGSTHRCLPHSDTQTV